MASMIFSTSHFTLIDFNNNDFTSYHTISSIY